MYLQPFAPGLDSLRATRISAPIHDFREIIQQKHLTSDRNKQFKSEEDISKISSCGTLQLNVSRIYVFMPLVWGRPCLYKQRQRVRRDIALRVRLSPSIV
jgi:hypothetical protein